MPRPHPYLHFSAQDVPALRERLKKPPFAEHAAVLQGSAEAALSAALPGRNAGSSLGEVREAQGSAVVLAGAYVLRGDRKYGEQAKKVAFALLGNSRWLCHGNVGVDLATGEASFACAIVYDWCHDVFTPDEKARFKERLLELSIQPYLKSRDWWIENRITNWAGVCHGGCGLAALALYDECPEARTAVERAWKHVQDFLRAAHPEDGGGHEGVMYHTYGTNFGLYFATAMSRFTGDDQGLFAELTRKLAGYYLIYLKGPDRKYANFNDMDENTFAGDTARDWERGPDAAQCALFESKVSGGDELLLWGADHGGSNAFFRGASPFFLLWRRDAPPAGPRPKLDETVLFRGNGYAVLGSPTLWFAYNGGWTSNMSHYNRDLGTFVLVANEERFVSDPGYGKTETAQHSTVLINGKGQVQDVRGAYPVFGSGKGFQYLASDLSKCGNGELKRFVRHVVLVRGAYLVMLDELAAAKEASFEWRLQTLCPIHVEGDRAVLKGKKGELHVLAVAPAGAKVSAGKAALDFVAIKPDAAKAQETFVTVLYPASPGGAAPSVKYTPDGKLTVGGDTLVFGRSSGDSMDVHAVPGTARLKSVNGEDATAVPSGTERSLTAFRSGGAVAARPDAAALASKAASPPPPAPPAVDAKALEVWRARLRERVIAAAQEGTQPAVRLTLIDPAPVAVKITRADAKGFTALVGGGTLPVPWEQLGGKDYLSLAQGYAKEGDGFAQALLGVFLIAEGRTSDGEGELAKALLSDAKAAGWVEEARALLARK